jgi:hypothetical protein
MPAILISFNLESLFAMNTIRVEPLEEDELVFLQRIYQKESKDYLFSMRILLVFTVLIPFLIALYYLLRFDELRLMWQAFTYALVTTLVLFLIVLYFLYQRNVKPYYLDTHHKTKTIERALITSKKHMPQTNTYHFYLNSMVKYSIEVSVIDYFLLEEMDEVNIEYSTHTHEYFGYF